MKNLPRNEVKNLLNLAARGDHSASSRLYAFYQPGVYGFIRKSVWDEGAADELTVETMDTAFRKPDAYNGLAEFSTWLCGIALNKVREWKRKNAKYLREISVDDPHILEAALDPVWDVLSSIEERELGDAILECMDRLPDAQREAIYWTAVENCSLEETALKMEVVGGTIKSRLFYARRAIRNCLERAVGDDYLGGKIG